MADRVRAFSELSVKPGVLSCRVCFVKERGHVSARDWHKDVDMSVCFKD